MCEGLLRGDICLYSKKSKKTSLVLIIRILDGKTALCVHVISKPNKFTVSAIIDGETRYIDYSQLLKARLVQLKNTNKKVNDSRYVVAKIYKKRKGFNIAGKRKRKRRVEREKEDRRMLAIYNECHQARKAEMGIGSTVGWSMTHPLQGGKTNPR